MPAYLPVCYVNVHMDIKMCRNTVLPVCFVCVKIDVCLEGRTWAEGVREFGAEQDIEMKGEEVTGEWRKLHDEQLHDLCSIHCVLVWR
jgi:hypothetical protein